MVYQTHKLSTSPQSQKRDRISDAREKLSEQIDWDFINAKKRDPQEFHRFIQSGRRMVSLVRSLNEI